MVSCFALLFETFKMLHLKMSMLILVRQKSVKYVHTLHVHTTHHKHTHTHISSHNVLQWDAREKHTTPNYCTMPSLYVHVCTKCNEASYIIQVYKYTGTS